MNGVKFTSWGLCMTLFDLYTTMKQMAIKLEQPQNKTHGGSKLQGKSPNFKDGIYLT